MLDKLARSVKSALGRVVGAPASATAKHGRGSSKPGAQPADENDCLCGACEGSRGAAGHGRPPPRPRARHSRCCCAPRAAAGALATRSGPPRGARRARAAHGVARGPVRRAAEQTVRRSAGRAPRRTRPRPPRPHPCRRPPGRRLRPRRRAHLLRGVPRRLPCAVRRLRCARRRAAGARQAAAAAPRAPSTCSGRTLQLGPSDRTPPRPAHLPPAPPANESELPPGDWYCWHCARARGAPLWPREPFAHPPGARGHVMLAADAGGEVFLRTRVVEERPGALVLQPVDGKVWPCGGRRVGGAAAAAGPQHGRRVAAAWARMAAQLLRPPTALAKALRLRARNPPIALHDPQDRRQYVVPRDDHRLWHGTTDKSAWTLAANGIHWRPNARLFKVGGTPPARAACCHYRSRPVAGHAPLHVPGKARVLRLPPGRHDTSPNLSPAVRPDRHGGRPRGKAPARREAHRRGRQRQRRRRRRQEGRPQAAGGGGGARRGRPGQEAEAQGRRGGRRLRRRR
jgi:hypothetical protein